MLNVGQGDSILYEGGKNQNVLIGYRWESD